jgi:hypothetical protein
MVIDELIPTVREMSRTDKWRLMQFLVTDLAEQEEESLIESLGITDKTFQIWSPEASVGAADALLAALNVEERDAQC